MINSERLKQILSSHCLLPEEEHERLLATAKIVEMNESQILINEQKTPEFIYLIDKGLLRAIYQSIDGNICSKEFYWEGDVIWFFRHLIESRPLPYSVASVENCVLYQLCLKTYLELVASHSSWKDYHIAQLNFYLHAKEVKEEMLLVNSNQEKVVKAYELFPDFVKRVPATLLASYLNLTPVSLSRIKKRLGLK